MRIVFAALALGLALNSAVAVAQVGPDDLGDSVQAALPTDLHTGLSGRVVLAPRCPVPLGGDEGGTCPSLPLATALAVRSADGNTEVAQVATDADGQFSVPLDPGQYLVVVPAPGGVRVSAQTLVVTVSADGPTTLTIQVRPTGGRTVP
jgi:hypothetical protein